eukprot:c23838_g1_i1 orf=652-1470(-)
MPAKRRAISLRYDINSSLANAGLLSSLPPKKLKRMPHIFCKLLELPCDAETPVEVLENQDAYTFVMEQPGLVAEEVRVEVIEIVPGAVKVVVRGAEITMAFLEQLGLDAWRFRLPACTLPEAARAVYEHGVLTVIVPKLPSSTSAQLREDGASVENDNPVIDPQRDDLWKQDGPANATLGSRHEGEPAPSTDERHPFGDGFHNARRIGDLIGNFVEAVNQSLVGKINYDGALEMFSRVFEPIWATLLSYTPTFDNIHIRASESMRDQFLLME